MTHSLTAALLLILTPAAASAQQIADRPGTTAGNTPSEQALVLGVRAGTLVGNGQLPVVRSYDTAGGARMYTSRTDAWESDGSAIDGEFGFRFARAWTFFAGYEYGASAADHLGPERFVTHAPHAGFRLTTNRKSVVGFVLEMGSGYRIVQIERDGRSFIASGVEPFRGGVGMTFAFGRHVRINAMFTVAAGQLTTFDAYGSTRELTGDDRNWHAFRSLTIGGTFDL